MVLKQKSNLVHQYHAVAFDFARCNGTNKCDIQFPVNYLGQSHEFSHAPSGSNPTQKAWYLINAHNKQLGKLEQKKFQRSSDTKVNFYAKSIRHLLQQKFTLFPETSQLVHFRAIYCYNCTSSTIANNHVAA